MEVKIYKPISSNTAIIREFLNIIYSSSTTFFATFAFSVSRYFYFLNISLLAVNKFLNIHLQNKICNKKFVYKFTLSKIKYYFL